MTDLIGENVWIRLCLRKWWWWGGRSSHWLKHLVLSPQLVLAMQSRGPDEGRDNHSIRQDLQQGIQTLYPTLCLTWPVSVLVHQWNQDHLGKFIVSCLWFWVQIKKEEDKTRAIRKKAWLLSIILSCAIFVTCYSVQKSTVCKRNIVIFCASCRRRVLWGQH